MKPLRLLSSLLCLGASLPVLAAGIACPDLSKASQVAACPTEQELEYTFTGFCSDDSRPYKGDIGVCEDYQKYRKLKNIALWESADGNFSSYVSCDRAAAEVKAAKPTAVRVAKQGKLTLLVCDYGDDLKFTLRTRVECKLDPAAAAACKGDPAACKATCE